MSVKFWTDIHKKERNFIFSDVRVFGHEINLYCLKWQEHRNARTSLTGMQPTICRITSVGILPAGNITSCRTTLRYKCMPGNITQPAELD
jgi:hypothetical protein